MMVVNGGSADEVRLETDEQGFEFVIESSEGTFRFNVHGLAHGGVLAGQLADIRGELVEWWEGGKQAAAEHERERRVLWPGETGYAPDDPKSPGYHDRMVGDA